RAHAQAVEEVPQALARVRRGPTTAPPAVLKTVALVDDLMDRTRLGAAIADLTFARDADDVAADADVVVIDLAQHGQAVAPVRARVPSARIAAYGPHVDDNALARARTDGADAALPRSRFFHDPAGAVAPPA